MKLYRGQGPRNDVKLETSWTESRISTKLSRENICQLSWAGPHKIAETRNEFDGITRTLAVSRSTNDHRNLGGTIKREIFETNYKLSHGEDIMIASYRCRDHVRQDWLKRFYTRKLNTHFTGWINEFDDVIHRRTGAKRLVSWYQPDRWGRSQIGLRRCIWGED